MRLTSKAINAIAKNNKAKAKLALEHDKSGYTIERWIDENEDNGKLTTAASLQIIQTETELTQDEILEAEMVG